MQVIEHECSSSSSSLPGGGGEASAAFMCSTSGRAKQKKRRKKKKEEKKPHLWKANTPNRAVFLLLRSRSASPQPPLKVGV